MGVTRGLGRVVWWRRAAEGAKGRGGEICDGKMGGVKMGGRKWVAGKFVLEKLRWESQWPSAQGVWPVGDGRGSELRPMKGA
jgi:hypothetical protein